MENNEHDQSVNSGTEHSGGVAVVRHCGDTYKACCLPYKTAVYPDGWCNCNCGDCRVAKYATLSKDADICWCGDSFLQHSRSTNHTFKTMGE